LASAPPAIRMRTRCIEAPIEHEGGKCHGMSTVPGASVKRKEDQRLVTGRGRFLDDIGLPRLLHAAMVRSAHAHARIVRVDDAAARRLPGVVDVITAIDVPECDVPALVPSPKLRQHAHPPIARGVARHAGEIVAVVIAETSYDAADGVSAM